MSNVASLLLVIHTISNLHFMEYKPLPELLRVELYWAMKKGRATGADVMLTYSSTVINSPADSSMVLVSSQMFASKF